MRCFVAIDLPEDVRAPLQAVQRELAAANADVRWVGPETFHLTLRFLGDLDEPTLGRFVDALRPALAARSPLRVIFDRIGAFPDTHDPQVVWVGCAGPVAELTSLATLVDRVATEAGAPPDRLPFAAHVTIGRVNTSSPALSAPLHAARVAASFEATGVGVYQSKPTRVASDYTILSVLPLGPA